MPPAATVPTAAADTTEPYVEYLVGTDMDVRVVLQKLAELGKMDLVIPNGIRKTISFHYSRTTAGPIPRSSMLAAS